MRKKWITSLFLLVVTILMLTVSLPAEEERFNVPVGASQVKGPANAPVTLIEFLDFQ